MKKYYGLLVLGGLMACEGSQQTTEKVLVDTVAMANHVRILASDDFLGRKPFTEGETKTLAYLENEFKSYGLEPGNGDSFFQEVPMVELNASPSPTLEISGANGSVSLNVSDEFVAYTERVEEVSALENSELVFAGFGVVAPEYGWNDYEGLDVKGKTVIVLVNDPDFGSRKPRRRIWWPGDDLLRTLDLQI